MARVSMQSRVVHDDNAVHHGGLFAARPLYLLVHGAEAPWDAVGVEHYLNTTDEKEASYHYLMDRGGPIHRMTPTTLVAYHAGDSSWPSPRVATLENQRPHGGLSLNRSALGIAWCNRGDGEPLTAAQVESGLWLCAVLMDDHRIPVERVLGHYEVSPGRKRDPRPAMDMAVWRSKLASYLAVTA